MGLKSDAGITLVQAEGVKNIFVNDWKVHFFEDDKKKIASIAFLRNLVEFTRGDKDPTYLRLTSMLHWRPETAGLDVSALDAIYNSECHTSGKSPGAQRAIIDVIYAAADECLVAAPGLNLENKVVLSIATRLRAERFIVSKINDNAFWEKIANKQTQSLIRKYKKLFPAESDIATLLDMVSIMTPENIHLNSFMYEPILDMSDDHLKRLYSDVAQLA